MFGQVRSDLSISRLNSGILSKADDVLYVPGSSVKLDNSIYFYFLLYNCNIKNFCANQTLNVTIVRHVEGRGHYFFNKSNYPVDSDGSGGRLVAKNT